MSTLVRLAAFLFLASAAHAQTINLSDYLSAPPGGFTCDSNPPFMESLSCGAYGFGRDCPGSFSSAQIRFADTAAFTHGIGVHPPNGGEKSLRFDLDQIRTLTGREPMSFQSRIGIDIPSGGGANGANFITTLDADVANTTNVPNGQASVQLSIPVSGTRFLKLATVATGSFNANHACWADAKLILGPECPTPAINQQPRSASTCPHTNITFSAIGTYWGPFTYVWRKNGDPISLANNSTARSPSLVLNNVSELDSGDYTCVITNSCGDTISNTAILRVCTSDFNCDTTVDFFDYLDFVSAFASNEPAADFNADTVIDFFDYLDFVAAFSTGC